MGGGIDSFLFESFGVLRAVNCNWNGNGWNVNANSVDNPNEWNAGNQVFSRNSYISPVYLAGVFFFKPFFHPPNILPTSSSFFESIRYFSLGISLFSQAICKKNLRTSSREIAFPSKTIFCSGGRYEAVKVNSNTQRKALSILWPSPKRSVLGKSRCKASQN
jgi:hypothetical protein